MLTYETNDILMIENDCKILNIKLEDFLIDMEHMDEEMCNRNVYFDGRKAKFLLNVIANRWEMLKYSKIYENLYDWMKDVNLRLYLQKGYGYGDSINDIYLRVKMLTGMRKFNEVLIWKETCKRI